MRHGYGFRLWPLDEPRSTVFLDRDGVINRKLDHDYVRRWSEFEFLPQAKEALRLLSRASCRIIVVTNQRGIARGLMSGDDLAEIHQRMVDEAADAAGYISGIYYCPHPADACDCRKPRTGLFLEARRDFPDIHFPHTTVIGDSVSDMDAAARLGCKAVFIGDDPRWTCAASLYEAVAAYL